MGGQLTICRESWVVMYAHGSLLAYNQLKGKEKTTPKLYRHRTSTLKTECYVCSLIYTQFDNGTALAIEFNSLVNSYHTLFFIGDKCANLCLNLP